MPQRSLEETQIELVELLLRLVNVSRNGPVGLGEPSHQHEGHAYHGHLSSAVGLNQLGVGPRYVAGAETGQRSHALGTGPQSAQALL